MSEDLTKELVRAKIEKAREAMGEATWCFDGEKYPAAVPALLLHVQSLLSITCRGRKSSCKTHIC